MYEQTNNQLATDAGHLPVYSRACGSSARDANSASRAAIVVDSFRWNAGPSSLLAKAKGRLMKLWLKDRPALTIYIAIVVTLELIVSVVYH